MKKVIGLTGGIASGKTTVAKFFKKLGADVINADIVGHVVQREKETINELVDTFGKDILTDGHVNRKKLGSIVFSDEAKLRKLNEIMHPRMYDKIKELINKSNSEIVILDMAILFEAGFDELCDEYVVVYSNKTLQLKRLRKRKVPKDKATDILNSQLDINEKIKLATYIIKNESTIYELKKKVLNLYNYLKSG